MFLVLFVLPAWLMVRHHKKSKRKTVEAKRENAEETPLEAEARKQDHYRHVVTVIALAVGYLIGSKLIGTILAGFLVSVVFGVIANFIMDRKYKKSGKD